MSYKAVSTCYTPTDYTGQLIQDAINSLMSRTTTTATGYPTTTTATATGTIVGVAGYNFYGDEKAEPKKEPAVLDISDGQLRCSLCHKVNPSTQHIRSHMSK